MSLFSLLVLSVLVDPGFRTQHARGLKGSAWSHNDRPELMNSFRAELAADGLRPPLIPEAKTEPSLAIASVEAITREARAAKSQVDVLIVSLHAGEEGSQLITPRQRSFARAAVYGGADLVIGHHPHVVQKSEVYRGKQIFYSLGNFVFSPAGRGTGALLDATLYPNGKITATLRRLSLAGGRPHFYSSVPAKR